MLTTYPIADFETAANTRIIDIDRLQESLYISGAYVEYPVDGDAIRNTFS